MPIATRVTVTELTGGNGSAVLTLPKGTKWFSQGFDRLFKRDFYDRFIDEYLEGFANPYKSKRVLLMGTPGIGKSSFALYAAWRALKIDKSVVYQHHESPSTYTVLTPGSDMVRKYENFRPPELEDPNAVFIVDGMRPQYAEAFTLFVSWPNHERVHGWTKRTGTLTFHFPTWTLDELKLMRTHCFDGRSATQSNKLYPSVELTDEELETRFDASGGVPRFIFDETKWRELPTEMNWSISKTLRDIRSLGLATALESEFSISHEAIHSTVNRDTFEIEGMDFASPQVARTFAVKAAKEYRLRLVEVLAAARDETELAEFRGRLLEALVYQHMLTSKAGWWVARSLDGGAGLVVPLPGKKARDYDDIDELRPGESGEPLLWRPRSQTNAAVDFIITEGRRVYFLQCTVGNTQDIVVRTFTGKNRGLLQQADALMRRGFDTAGELNFVHVTEAATEPVYIAGRLTLGKAKARVPEGSGEPGSEASMTGSGEATAGYRRGGEAVTDADRARVKQFVATLTASPSKSSHAQRAKKSALRR
jgi:hypothetical protein